MSSTLLRIFAVLGAMAFDGVVIGATPVKSQQLPAKCASARGVAGTHWEFHNGCEFPVYWAIVCAVGAERCYGRGNIVVEAGGNATRDLNGGPWEIDGPYR
jgi:hypothetical protein